MSMNRIIISVIFLISFIVSNSQEVSESFAVKMANYYFQMFQSENKDTDDNVDSIMTANHKLAIPEQISPNGRANMWLVPVKDGWILLSGSMKATPILAYIPSLKKPIYDSLPPAAQELLDSYEDYIAYINNDADSFDIDSRWLYVLSDIEDTTKNTNHRSITVGPLLTVNWGQSGGGSCPSNKIYNKFCPTVIDPDRCNKAPAGCVAVAIAQIMWYWKWPYAAQIPMTVGGNDTILKYYNWNLMPTSINNSTSMDKVDRIAEVLHDCGYKLGMNYGAGGSSAGDDDAENALKAFGYDENTLDLRYKYNTSGWTNMLRTNIDNGQPVYYSGQKQMIGGKGHAFVVDGYQTGGPIYHINWGWKGSYNGWYNIDDAYINDTIHYNYWQAAIFGIRPAPRYCTDLTITSSVESPRFCIAQAGQVTISGVNITNITEGRVFSAEQIRLTNGTHLSNCENIYMAIKPVPCTPPALLINMASDNNEDSTTSKQMPSRSNIFNPLSSVATKILRDGHIFILVGDRTYTITGQPVE